MTESRNATALITGASRGLGSVLATFLAGNDYDLILTARGADDLAEKKKSIERSGFGSSVHTVAGDISDTDHRRELGRLVAELGGIDLLINNASALGPSPLPTLAEHSLDEFKHVYDVNTVAPLALIQELLPFFEGQGWKQEQKREQEQEQKREREEKRKRERQGLIVNITSDAAIEGYPGWGGYGASKAALELLTKTLANEQSEVGVVMVDPGDMRTEMHQRAFPGEDITDRPLPDVTIPFWSWLLGQDPLEINGGRFQAQAEQWEVP